MTSCNTNKQVPVSVNGLLSLNQQKHFVSDTGEHPQSRVCTGLIRNTHPQQPPGLSWIKHQSECVCLCVCVWERVFTYMGVLFKYKWPALLINLIKEISDYFSVTDRLKCVNTEMFSWVHVWSRWTRTSDVDHRTETLFVCRWWVKQ